MATIKSLEEKAKAYDEATKRAKEWYNDNQIGIGFKANLEKLFPELKESEDERVRKGLLYVIEHHPTLPTEEAEEYIAWLEKQSEQKLDGTFVNVDDVREDFVNEVYRVLDADSTNDRANQIIDAFDNLPTVAIEKQGEQKPVEWSEEDENWLINAINVCKLNDYNETAEWLKNKLKLLRPQNTWKPSAEMLEALYRAIPENVMEISEDDMLLDKLYQGLKYGKVLY